MNRPEITDDLSRRLEIYIDCTNDTRIYWAKEVTFDYSTSHAIRVDYMEFKPVNNTVSGIEKGDFFCYEIKSSVEDFRSKNGHNFIGDFNFYVMPKEVFKTVKALIPLGIGVLTPAEYSGLVPAKLSRRMDRRRPCSEMLLMMYRSARRELVKKRRHEMDGATT